MKKLRQIRFPKAKGTKKILYQQKFTIIIDGKKIEITNLEPEDCWISIDK